MKKYVMALVASLLIAAPGVTGAAWVGTTSTELPAASDQLLGRDMIQLAEEHLSTAGLNPGPVDGVFDSQTEVAVRAYQRNHRFVETGLLDEQTRAALIPGLNSSEGDG